MWLACRCVLVVQLLHASAAWLLLHHHVQATGRASGHAWKGAKAIRLGRLLQKGPSPTGALLAGHTRH
jgi:hypothetical protein